MWGREKGRLKTIEKGGYWGGQVKCSEINFSVNLLALSCFYLQSPSLSSLPPFSILLVTTVQRPIYCCNNPIALHWQCSAEFSKKKKHCGERFCKQYYQDAMRGLPGRWKLYVVGWTISALLQICSLVLKTDHITVTQFLLQPQYTDNPHNICERCHYNAQ